MNSSTKSQASESDLDDQPSQITEYIHDTQPRSRLTCIKNTLIYAVRRLIDDQLTQAASSLAYTTVLAVVPLLTVILALFTIFPVFNDFKVYLDNFLRHNLMPESISENIFEYLNSFAQSASQMTTVGVIFLFVTSIMLMMTIEEALNKIWHVKRSRGLLMRILMYWAVLSLGPIILSLSLWISGFVLQKTFDQYISIGRQFMGYVFPWIMSVLGLTLLYYTVPNRRVAFKDALIGGVVSGSLFEILKAGFAFYITNFPSYTLIYGAFATVPLFLLWIYISWIIVLLGAAIAAMAPQIRLGHFKTHYESGLLLVIAVQILRDLFQARDSQNPGLTLENLIKRVKIDPNTLLEILDSLQDLGYIANTTSKDGDTWVLVCSQNADLTPIFDRLLFNDQLDAIQEDKRLLHAFSLSLQEETPVILKNVL
ncbi:YihY family inner membrane protein, partial [Brackiella oedipodis]|uniref:YihY family inner membrane protein n=1 Tax=Brackiella oedipodis TaxID=124225 RepID=UPI00057003CF